MVNAKGNGKSEDGKARPSSPCVFEHMLEILSPGCPFFNEGIFANSHPTSHGELIDGQVKRALGIDKNEKGWTKRIDRTEAPLMTLTACNYCPHSVCHASL